MSPDSNISVEDDLKDLLKRCPPGTFEAAVAFRKNKDASYVEKIVMGIIDRHLEPDQQADHNGNQVDKEIDALYKCGKKIDQSGAHGAEQRKGEFDGNEKI